MNFRNEAPVDREPAGPGDQGCGAGAAIIFYSESALKSDPGYLLKDPKPAPERCRISPTKPGSRAAGAGAGVTVTLQPSKILPDLPPREQQIGNQIPES